MLKLNMSGKKFQEAEVRQELRFLKVGQLAESPWGFSKHDSLSDRELDQLMVGEEVRVYGADLETQFKLWDLEQETGIRVTFEK